MLTGKKHLHVMRDIRVILLDLDGEAGVSKFGYTHVNQQNKETYPIYRLPRPVKGASIY
jgi:hypothetical protein